MTRMFGARTLLSAALAVAAAGVVTSASGPVGIYGIVQRVVFEPSERAPERLQVWGAFAYAELGRGHVEVEFNRASAQTGARQGGSAQA